MIYSPSDIKAKIIELAEKKEDEVVELKEANNGYSFKKIGKYFSALGNEANLRGREDAWLVFGVTDDGEFVGTDYRKDGGLQSMKKEIVGGTNDRRTFMEIYETEVKGVRVIAFQIPPASRGIPSTWFGAAYAREDDGLCPLPMDKLDRIRAQSGVDWSADVVRDATIDDLDPEAIQRACELYLNKQRVAKKATPMLETLSDVDLLTKAGVLVDGKITNTALLLLGKEESSHYFDGLCPQITWTLYNADGSVKAYEHIKMPLLLAVDRTYAKIRNEKYRYISGQQTLFPDETYQYDEDVVKEIINNCIAHSDYQLRGRINVMEYEDRLVFMNEAGFIPETIENALEDGYKPPYYRNTFLCNAMVSLYMIDTDSIGIPTMFRIQRKRCFPLPSYDLSTPNRVKVTLYGRILDKSYTKLLHANGDLDLHTVFLLDKIQKGEEVSKEDCDRLRENGLIEGRYPRVFVSFEVADITGRKTEYIRNKGLKNDSYQVIILDILETAGESTVGELLEMMESSLPQKLDSEQKRRKVSNLLQSMRSDGVVDVKGIGRGARWILIKD